MNEVTQPRRIQRPQPEPTPSGDQRPLSERLMILLVLATFLIGLPAIFAYPAERVLFEPASDKQALAEEHAYEQFPLLTGQMLAEGGNVMLFGSGNRLLEVLQRSNYDVFVRQIFPTEWVQAQADSLIDQFWAFFNFQSPDFKLLVDFRPVKARLSGEQSGAIAAGMMQALPPCQGEDLGAFAQGLLNGSVDRLPLCQPPGMFQSLSNTLVDGLLHGLAAAMPDQLDFATFVRLSARLGGQRVSSAWSLGFGTYHLYRLANPWLPVIALVLLALAGVMAYYSERGPLYWLGVALLLPGVIALLSALILGLLAGSLAPWVIARLFGANLVLFDLLARMLALVTGRFMLASALIALVVTLAGGILIGAALWMNRVRGEAGELQPPL